MFLYSSVELAATDGLRSAAEAGSAATGSLFFLAVALAGKATTSSLFPIQPEKSSILS